MTDHPPLTYTELHLQCQKLKEQARVDEIAFGNMSREICELNAELETVLRELSAVVEHISK